MRLLLSLLLLAPLAHAEPCDDDAPVVADVAAAVAAAQVAVVPTAITLTVPSYGADCTEGDGAKKKGRCTPKAEALTCREIAGMTVCNMRYCAEFDCDDFAWAFDEVCEDKGIPCWEAKLHAWPSFFGKRTGHVVNVVQMTLPFASIYDKYAVVEPQTNQVMVTWLQEKGETPKVPQAAYETLGDHYDWFDQPYQRVTVFQDGHSSTAGERPFTKVRARVQEFRRRTGLDPAGFKP